MFYPAFNCIFVIRIDTDFNKWNKRLIFDCNYTNANVFMVISVYFVINNNYSDIWTIIVMHEFYFWLYTIT